MYRTLLFFTLLHLCSGIATVNKLCMKVAWQFYLLPDSIRAQTCIFRMTILLAWTIKLLWPIVQHIKFLFIIANVCHLEQWVMTEQTEEADTKEDAS